MANFKLKLDLNKVRDVDPYLMSYNVEMTEVTGGTCWKAYSQEVIEGKAEFPPHVRLSAPDNSRVHSPRKAAKKPFRRSIRKELRSKQPKTPPHRQQSRRKRSYPSRRTTPFPTNCRTIEREWQRTIRRPSPQRLPPTSPVATQGKTLFSPPLYPRTAKRKSAPATYRSNTNSFQVLENPETSFALRCYYITMVKVCQP